jgi:NAD(P)-dependent dehydrogenase (short-subunit alcohol dehydrogenase family)
MTWATNVLGYFLLTELLLPALKKAAPARIVNVASELAGDLDLGDVQFKTRPYRGRTA